MASYKVKTNFPENLKKIRSDSGMSGNRVAQLLGITQPAYNGYETGRTEPPYYLLVELANLFNCPIDAFFGRSTIQPNASVCIVGGDNNSNINNRTIDNTTHPDCAKCITVQSLKEIINQLIEKGNK